MAKAVASKTVVAPKVAIVAPLVKVTAEVTNITIYSTEIDENLEVEDGKFTDGYLSVGNMEICSDGLNDLMDLSENQFTHLVATITALRAKVKELKK